jgi:selenocysteine-specific elongation factor
VSLVIGTAGHIDHGKSALVKALTGTDPDRLKEEQARGITIDLGFAHATLDGVDVAFVDVPGHERFIHNMLAGAAGVDAVLLVVAADESVMPQTREHLDLCRLLGVGRGLVVLTKIDAADGDLRAIARGDAAALVRGSFLEGAPIVEVSARTGEGLDALRAAIAMLARERQTPALPATVSSGRVPRLPIDRVFTIRGFGTVVTGTLVAGRVAEGDELSILPSGRSVRLRGVQVHGHAVPVADAPNRVALNLAGVDVADLARGDIVTRAGALTVTRRVDARVELLAGGSLRHGARVRVHQGTSDTIARVVICAWRERGGDWTQPGVGDAAVSVPAGSDAYVRLRLTAPVDITRGDRLIVRALAPVVTIGGGVVLDPSPVAGPLRRAAALDRFRALDPVEAPADADARAVRTWIADAGVGGVDARAIAARGGMSPADADRLIGELTTAGAVTMVGPRAYDATVAGRVAAAVSATLESYHRAQALEIGMPRESVREQAIARLPVALFDAVVDRLVADRIVTGTDRLALVRHHAPATPETRAAEGIEAAVLRGGLTPPDSVSLAAETSLAPDALDRAVRLLVRDRRLVRVGELVFHPQTLAALKEEIRALPAASPGRRPTIDVATFKTRFGLSRKFAIPLLEWLDRERVTRRVGESREVI